MNDLLNRMLAGFAERTPRERLLIGIAGSFLLVALVWLGVVNPILNGAERSTRRIDIASQQLRVMERLRADYDASKAQLSSVESRIEGTARGNLRTALEGLATQASVYIDSMEPQSAPTNPSYQETKVEVGLKNVTLTQVINYLHRIENANQVYSIKSLRIKTRPDRSELLDVNFSVSSFEPI